jgi:hypothetical protein
LSLIYGLRFFPFVIRAIYHGISRPDVTAVNPAAHTLPVVSAQKEDKLMDIDEQGSIRYGMGPLGAGGVPVKGGRTA